MWPLMLGFGVWIAAEAIRQGVRENTEVRQIENRSRLERFPLTDADINRYIEDSERNDNGYRNRLR
jgi:hypothetical protein